ncbi:thioredoxin-like 1-1, chloroplastic [Sesamum indicum]|uniref:Thioredoxin-like 1-1, chloroplastic n=1 Tax=Sesamum indicum TaxID=4182 RepID=A0A6I9U0C7_SESIN|nr:thioredoxin-like 1-1, chloroplastic [Sesamum indicum]
MSYCLKAGFSVSGSSEILVKNRGKGSFRVGSTIGTLQFKESNPKEFWGKALEFSDQKAVCNLSIKAPKLDPVYAQASVSFGKALRWWEKSLQPNMIEINSAQELVDSLLNAGDRLVIVDFYSPGCGGCKALHPKICQLAELNPDAVFLKVDYEQHKAMCYALHVHVLPFFRFYRGADGRVCSFSCTNATIKKFKDALAKHGTERCSLGPAKGLDESELLALASIGQISRSTAPKPTEEEKVEDLVLQETAKSSTAFIKDDSKIAVEEGNAMAMA